MTSMPTRERLELLVRIAEELLPELDDACDRLDTAADFEQARFVWGLRTDVGHVLWHAKNFLLNKAELLEKGASDGEESPL
jgi:hypothetical protein